MQSTLPTFKLIKYVEQLKELETSWKQLWSTSGESFYVSYDYCYTSWIRVQKPLGRELAVIAGYKDEKLILIWPLVRYKDKMWNLIRPLTSYSGQMSGVILHPDFNNVDILKSAWNYLQSEVSVHILNFPFVNGNTTLHQFLNSQHPAGHEYDNAPYIKNEGSSWNEYYDSLGGDYRRSITRRSKKLTSDCGEYQTRLLVDTDKVAQALNWFIEHKKKWVEKVGKVDPDLDSENFKTLMSELVMTINNPSSVFLLFSLSIGDQLLAVKICSQSKSHANRAMAAYDIEYSKYGVGVLLDKYVNSWFYSQGLNIHCGAGGEEAKLIWSKKNKIPMTSFQIPVNQWGQLAFITWKTIKAIRERNQHSG